MTRRSVIAKVGPDAAWQALVGGRGTPGPNTLDQWDKFKFHTDHGPVYVSIGRAAECPDASNSPQPRQRPRAAAATS